ncbi:MAG: MAPEG family protein [Alphaproteobacteria bacterium]
MAQLHTMMAPVLALIVWTFVMLLWMYATRLPAIQAAGIDPAKIKGKETYGLMAGIPPKVGWVADNYNHLHEQPTIFYALCTYSFLVGVKDDLNIGLAWAYVAVRVIHSLVQAISNFVPVRFVLFILGSLVLLAITVRNVWAVFVS